MNGNEFIIKTHPYSDQATMKEKEDMLIRENVKLICPFARLLFLTSGEVGVGLKSKVTQSLLA